MDFPARHGKAMPLPVELVEAVGASPVLALDTKPILLLFDKMADVAALRHDFGRLKAFCNLHDKAGVIVTAIADTDDPYDFVSRFFAPAKGVNEDPVTGSAHTVLVPFWAERLGITDLVARQISVRGGTLWCTLSSGRVVIRGRCHDYLSGLITLPF